MSVVAAAPPGRVISRRPLAVVGIVLSALVPIGVIVGAMNARLPLEPSILADVVAKVMIFGAPSGLAVLGLRRRPVLLMSAVAATAVSLLLFVLAIPAIVAAVLWAVAFSSVPATSHSARQAVGAAIAAASVFLALFLYLGAPTQMACVARAEHADGTTTTRVWIDASSSHDGALTSAGDDVHSESTSCEETPVPVFSLAAIGAIVIGMSAGARFSAVTKMPISVIPSGGDGSW